MLPAVLTSYSLFLPVFLGCYSLGPVILLESVFFLSDCPNLSVDQQLYLKSEGRLEEALEI